MSTVLTEAVRVASVVANAISPVWMDAYVYSTTCHSATPSNTDTLSSESCRFVAVVIFAFRKSSAPYDNPDFRYVTRGKLCAMLTAEIATLTDAAVMVWVPRWTDTPLGNSATYHSIVIAGALGPLDDRSRWNRRVVASRIFPETCVSPASDPSNARPKVRNDFAGST